MQRVKLVERRRGRTGEVANLVDFEINRFDHIALDELKQRIVAQMIDIAPIPAAEIIEADDAVAARR